MLTAVDKSIQIGELAVPIRRQQVIAAVNKSGQSRIVQRQGLESVDLPREVYGLCWDSYRKGIWASDKRSAKLCFFPGASMGQVGETLSSPGAFEPCGLDWNDEHGLLVAYFGSCIGDPTPGAVFSYDLKGTGRRCTPESFSSRVAKCVWINNSFAFVSYYESVIYLCSLDGRMTALTAPSRRALPSTGGALPDLHFRNIQSLYYYKAANTLLVGDSNYGAIYALDLNTNRYYLYAGRPHLSCLGERPILIDTDGLDASQWLGAICSIFEWGGQLCWLSGDTGFILPLQRNDIMMAIAQLGIVMDSTHLPTTVAIHR